MLCGLQAIAPWAVQREYGWQGGVGRGADFMLFSEIFCCGMQVSTIGSEVGSLSSLTLLPRFSRFSAMQRPHLPWCHVWCVCVKMGPDASLKRLCDCKSCITALHTG